MTPAIVRLCSGPWALHPDTFTALCDVIERHASGVRMTEAEIEAATGRTIKEMDDSAEPAMEIRDGTAIVNVRGILARYADSVNRTSQPRGRSAESLQADLTKAADAGVARIVLRIDSPGGEVAGTQETADLIRSISARGIPVTAYVDGHAMSAAYWLASQADEIVASSPLVMVGSIGVVSAIRRPAADRLLVIQSGSEKLTEALTDESIAVYARAIQDMHAVFRDAVQLGRGLTDEQIDAVGNGGSYTARRGTEMGLVDRFATWAQVLTGPQRAGRSTKKQAAGAAKPQKGGGMNLTGEELAALVQAHPEHATAIATAAQAGTTAAEIRSVIDGRERAQLGEKITALEAELAEAKAANAQATEQHAAEIADLRAQVDAADKAKQEAETKLAQIQGTATVPPDPGAGDGDDAPARRGEMTATQKADYIKNHGADAYARLPE